jgi:Cu2+-exporting ATPase
MIKACIHCGEDTKDIAEDFCCLGCGGAYKIINNLGLSSYYRLRQINEKERKLKPEIGEEVDISEFITAKDGVNSVTLMVQGLHCAACVWLIETILKKQKDVVVARINLSQKTLLLQWRGEEEMGNQLTHLVSEVGYKLLPFDVKILQEADKKYSDRILKALAVAGFGAGNLMLLSISLWFSDSLDMGEQTRNLLQFFSGLIAIPVVIFSARPFFSSAYKSIRAGYPNMDLPISLAITLACVVSVLQMIQNANHVYFDSAVMLTFFLLIGRYLDLKTRKKAFSIVSEFTLLSASFGRVYIEDKIVTLPIRKLREGMILLVAAGEKIAADGVVIDGESEVDASMITGEVLPKNIVENSEVFSGTINLGAPIKVKITKAQSETLLSKIVTFASEAENKKNHYVRLADKLARFYTPIVHILALATFAFWFSDGFEVALLNATAVLIITCPCALALAIPIVQTITISDFIKRGILVKSGEALEKLSEAEIVVFDKTGSLTFGAPKLVEIELVSGGRLNEKQRDYYLEIAASLAQKSRHPLSKAISEAFTGKPLDLKVLERQGFGLVANFENKLARLGRREFCEIKTLRNPNELSCFLKIGDEELILFFEDKIKFDAAAVISKLKMMNKRVILLSGDVENTVKKVADEIGISEYYFEKTPLSKVQFLQELKDGNQKFIMVGDGVNDAPALALSDISISFSRASDIAQNIADIVICGDDLSPVIELIDSSKRAMRFMKSNLVIALIYNLIAVPFAILGYVIPLVAAASMSASSLLVLLNSLRVKKNKS